jgi:hypothetical protein
MSQWFESTFCAESSSTFFCRRGQRGVYACVSERKQSRNKKGSGTKRVAIVRRAGCCCSMRGLNPRPLAHKTNTLPTELMEPRVRARG